MTSTEWLRLLNRKGFFWPTEERVGKLLGALAYADPEHLVFVIDTASLLAMQGPETTRSPQSIQGAVLYDPPPRGRETLAPIAAYQFQYWRQRRRSARKAIAEIAVDYAVPDIRHTVTSLQIAASGVWSVRVPD